jgi:hypothetical protein
VGREEKVQICVILKILKMVPTALILSFALDTRSKSDPAINGVLACLMLLKPGISTADMATTAHYKALSIPSIDL